MGDKTQIKDSVAHGQCRCCLRIGYHLNIFKRYDTDIYYNMFADCFNLYLTTNKNISTLICTLCVKQLSDAIKFKTLVVESETHLLSVVGDKDMLCVDVPEVPIEIQTELIIKDEEIEIDVSNASEENTSEVQEPLDQNSSEEDYTKDEQTLISRFSSEARALPMTITSLYDICPTFAMHLERLKASGEVITLEMLEKQLEKPPRPTIVAPITRKIPEKILMLDNICTIIENSNVTPFRLKNSGLFPCYYCTKKFETLQSLKHHTSDHKKTEARYILSSFYGSEALICYVDVTDLKCTICDKNMKKLNELRTHLTNTHGKRFHNCSDRIIPFKLSENNIFNCQVCGFNFETFGCIERHMNTHYRNYICTVCGNGFVTKYRLKIHMKTRHEEGNYPCEVCNKVFLTKIKMRNHLNTVHKSVKRFRCPKCPERFKEYTWKQRHLVSVHGAKPLRYNCNVCDRSFDRRFLLSRHLKRDHLEEREFMCKQCSYKCFTNNELTEHMIRHNGQRIFECNVCHKSYARIKTLKEHMRIHNNDRRFKCVVCLEPFVQKCSLKAHLKTHHNMELGAEIVNVVAAI